ncbi:hypothetical protein Fcan01_01723 [Folsomia candida]|uniref:Uncharacterized protein n=2 Tax=Folsomia candida TaxID=158441 RepID=A0A226F2Q3_FOLCA|nr:hypothetical protein Fcan01_01723 [Folsomia candida]
MENVSKKRFSFKSNAKYDIALLTEVEAINPFAFNVQKVPCEEVADNLVKSDLKMAVNERSCRERTNLLLRDFKKDEAISARSSGISEDDLDELRRLLTTETEREAAVMEIDLDESSNDYHPEEKEEEKTEKKEEEKTEKKEGSVGSVKDKIVSPVQTKRSRKGDIVSYLEKKNKMELDLKTEEVSVRKYEAETRRMEMEIMKQQNERDYQLKLQELELRKKIEGAQAEEKLAMTKAMLELLQRK